MEFGLAKVVLGIIAVAPPGFTLAFAESVGWLVFHLLPGRAKIATDNIRAAGIVRGEPELRRLGCRCFQSLTRMVAETVITRNRIRPDNWQNYVTIDAPPETFAQLKDTSRGAIIASGHLGNWDVAARALSMLRPVSVIYRPFNNPYLDREINSERGGTNLHLISKYKTNPMRFMKLLADGDCLALMIDQHISEAGERVRVNFFGRPCWATRSVAMMHMTTRLPLFVAVAARTGRLKFTAHLAGPIRWERTGNREADVLGITQAMTDEIEKIARRYPEQYLWGHRRWRE